MGVARQLVRSCGTFLITWIEISHPFGSFRGCEGSLGEACGKKGVLLVHHNTCDQLVPSAWVMPHNKIAQRQLRCALSLNCAAWVEGVASAGSDGHRETGAQERRGGRGDVT